MLPGPGGAYGYVPVAGDVPMAEMGARAPLVHSPAAPVASKSRVLASSSPEEGRRHRGKRNPNVALAQVKTQFTSLVDKYKPGLSSDWRVWTDVDSTEFQLVSGFFICLNAVVMGVQTDRPDLVFVWLFFDHLFVFFFTCELVARVKKRGCAYFSFKGEDAMWNYLDLFLVGFGLVDLFVVPFFLGEELDEVGEEKEAGIPKSREVHSMHMLRLIRLARLFRLLRLLRVVRLFRMNFFRGLLHFATSFLKASQTLVGGMIIVSLFMYVMAIFITNLVKNGPVSDDATHQKGQELFGTIADTMTSLFVVMTLDGWSEVARVAADSSGMWFMWPFFVGWIFMSTFVLASLMSGVLSEQMSQADAQKSKQKLERHLNRLDNVMKDMRVILNSATLKHTDGQISEDELEDVISKLGSEPLGQVLLNEFGIDADTLRCLFDVSDFDNTRSVEVEDLLAGVERLVQDKPNARELLVIQFEVKRVHALLQDMLPQRLRGGDERELRSRRAIRTLLQLKSRAAKADSDTDSEPASPAS